MSSAGEILTSIEVEREIRFQKLLNKVIQNVLEEERTNSKK